MTAKTVPPTEDKTPTLQDTLTLIESATKGSQQALSILVRYRLLKFFPSSHSWNQLHRREGDRCCMTGAPSITNESARLGDPSGLDPVDVEVAHILPYSLNRFNEGNSGSSVSLEHLAIHVRLIPGQHVADVTWDLLRTWASVDIQQWVGENINDPGNAILLSAQFHKHFDNFRIWFEKVS